MGGLTDIGFDYNGAWGGTMQMGGSLPGSVGFMYARTQSPAPSNGPYAKKTKPSAQNGMEMKYWQEGLDFKPKTISENGSWLEKYQPGGVVPLRQLMQEENKKLKGKADATKVASKSGPKKLIGSPYRDQGTISVPYERSAREQVIADLKRYDDPVRSLVTSPVISALNLLRPDRYFENVRTESDIPGVLFNAGLDVVNAIPVAVPLDEALEVVNQYVPLRPSQLASDLNDLRRVAFPPKPVFANPQTQELLSNVRNVGILSKTGATNAEVLEKVLKKAEGLSPVQFKNLTGFSKDDILERIKALKENPQGKKPATVTDEVILHRDTDMGYEFYRDANGEVRNRRIGTQGESQTGEPGFLSREAQERISGEIDNEMAVLSGRRQSRTLIPERQNIVSTEQMSPERIAELDRIISTGSWGAGYSDNVLTADPWGLRLNNPFGDKNLIRRATDFLSNRKYMEKTPSFESESLIGTLARTDTNNPATEMLRAYRRVKEAPKGSKFKSSGSLSTDSYPATLQLSKKALQEGIVDINYTGMEGLNTMGFSQSALLPSEYNVGEINNIIKELNQYLPKKLPYAYKSESKGIVAPQISFTKKKNGGWLEKFQEGGSKSKQSILDFLGNVIDVASYISPTQAVPNLIKSGAKKASKVAMSRVAENLSPWNYSVGDQSIASRMIDAVVLNKKEADRKELEKLAKSGKLSPDDKIRLDLLQMYAGKPQQFKTMVESAYKPTVAKGKGGKYYSSPELEQRILEDFGNASVKSEQDLRNLIMSRVSYMEDPNKKGEIIPQVGKSGKNYTATIPGLGEATYGVGEDEKGLYLSYYDKWDLNPFKGIYSQGASSENAGMLDKLGLKYLSEQEDLSMGLATPPEVYGRIYFDKKTGKRKTFQEGGIIEDPMGQWAHPGEITRIPSNEITMQGVDYPVMGISDTGDVQMMQPGQDYTFDGNSVTEIPMMQKGGKLKKFVTDIGTAMSTAINPAMGVANMVEPAADLLASTLMPYDTVEQREDIFRRYRPIEYPGFVNITRGLLYPDEQGKPGKDPEEDLNLGEEAWRKALDLPTKQKYIVPSKYKPSTAKDKNTQYYTLKDVIDPEKLIAEAKKRGWKPGAEYQMESLKPFIKDKRFSWDTDFSDIDPLQRFKMSIDPKGEYVSIYDVYDFDFPGINKMIKPFEFYDRFYPKKVKIYENKENGGWLSKYE
jgi:hypothetical protein